MARVCGSWRQGGVARSLAWACLLALAAGVSSPAAETVPVTPPKQPAPLNPPAPATATVSREMAHLVAKLGSNDWAERETAAEALLAAGSRAVPDLESGLARTQDPEARMRIQRLLLAVRPFPMEGTYTQTGHDAWDKDGTLCEPSNLRAYGTLVIEKGQMTWTQKYSGSETATQVYTFRDTPGQTVGDGLKLELTWRKIDTNSQGYLPDSVSPQLVFQRGRDGLKLVFTYQDEGGSRGRVTFTPGLLPPPEEPEGGKDEPEEMPPIFNIIEVE